MGGPPIKLRSIAACKLVILEVANEGSPIGKDDSDNRGFADVGYKVRGGKCLFGRYTPRIPFMSGDFLFQVCRWDDHGRKYGRSQKCLKRAIRRYVRFLPRSARSTHCTNISKYPETSANPSRERGRGASGIRERKELSIL